jgi:acyl-CoA synthetase (AMP-forming)/AMP-acid ligase II/acyl carrier protein
MAYLRELIVTQEVTVLHALPSVVQLLLGVPGIEQCTSLRAVTAGGEELPLSTAREFTARLPWCSLFNGYGPTEATVYASWWECTPEALAEVTATPLGRAFGGSRIHVLDAMQCEVPPGGIGELVIGGVAVSRGYHGKPALTAERFVPDPFGGPGGRLYRTGDLVRLRPDRQSLEFLGRSDAQVKIRGLRVEPAEVESVLAEHPDVTECVVVSCDIAPGDRRLVAYVAGGADPGELTERANRVLQLQAVPALIVPVTALPRLPNGKVNRRDLPEPVFPAAGLAIAPARTGPAAAVAEAWAEVLGVPDIAPGADFFAMGGHSLLAMRIVMRVGEWLDIEVPLSTLFERPVFDDFVAAVEKIAVVEETRG